ncbi:MAG: DUF4830 domain-containing protein [Ruminococcaceae bacterium]|nr:DUF4830 domain-containing protein [Oscillospiraceae bacterium]
MYTKQIRLPKKRVLFAWLLCLAVVLAAVVFRFEKGSSQATGNVSVTDSFSVADYVASFGVLTDAESLVIDEVIIPNEFNEVYESYNAVQKQQGFNLEEYKGCTLIRYTLKVNNYSDKSKEVFVEVMTYKQKVVAADIYCTDADGFIMALK